MISPDQRVFREHVTTPQFIDGVHRGRWRIEGDFDWPYVLAAVSAAPRDSGPPEFFLRFDMTGYPALAPTAAPWNPVTGDVLEPSLRPKGHRVGHVFRTDWEHGKALYAPFDRVALGYHPDWRLQYPRHAWDSSKDMAWIFQCLFEMLNDADYVGI